MKPFLRDLIERAIRAFAGGLLAAFTVGQTIATLHWLAVLDVAATAALVSILLSLLSLGTSGKNSASLLPAAPPVSHGRHEANTTEGKP